MRDKFLALKQFKVCSICFHLTLQFKSNMDFKLKKNDPKTFKLIDWSPNEDPSLEKDNFENLFESLAKLNWIKTN